MNESKNYATDPHKYDNVKFGPNVTKATEEMEEILLKCNFYEKISQREELDDIYETLRQVKYTTINESEEIKSKFDPYEEIDLNEDMSEKIKIGKDILKKLGL
jgi:hypothetical protein